MGKVTLKQTPCEETDTTDYTVQKPMLSIDSRAQDRRIVLQNEQDKISQASHQWRLSMKYSSGLPQGTELRKFIC